MLPDDFLALALALALQRVSSSSQTCPRFCLFVNATWQQHARNRWQRMPATSIVMVMIIDDSCGGDHDRGRHRNKARRRGSNR